MSIKNWNAGIIRPVAVAPAGPLGNGAAPGVWTLDQAAFWQKQGLWPIAGNFIYIEDVFSTYLYTGNGSTQTITNGIDLSGKGGLVWTKVRSTTYSHFLADTARGAVSLLSTNNTSAADTGGNLYSGFNNNGYGVTTSYGSGTNGNGQTFVSWTFREQPKFFDIVTYTGNGAASRNISHNLNSVPGCIICKATSTSDSWGVYHRSLGADGLYLNATNIAGVTLVPTNHTSTTFEVANGYGLNNANGVTYVAYLFAHDAGGFGLTGSDNVISCGSYTGNGSTTGPTITLGYEPQWLLTKRASGATSNWFITDNMRGMPVSGNEYQLYPNLSSAESYDLPTPYSPTATGFNVTSSGSDYNASAATYIYIAIRRGPMKTPTSGTSVFSPVAYTGNDATNRNIQTGFPIDWYMLRNGIDSSTFTYASSRLQGSGTYLFTNTTAAQASIGIDYLNTYQQNGIVLSQTTSDFNTSSIPYMLWGFRRAPGFLDVVCYTGTGSATTVSHNLGVAPELIMVKSRSAVNNWVVYCKYLSTPESGAVFLNLSNDRSGVTDWNNTLPTSSVFSLGSVARTNGSGTTFVAYLFATVAGVSKVGSYTGSGTTKQIDCGFTGGARFVLIKRTDSTGDWYVWDSARGIVAGNDPYLLLNSDLPQVTGTDYVDTYSAGFEISSTAPAAINANGGSFIFLAIA